MRASRAIAAGAAFALALACPGNAAAQGGFQPGLHAELRADAIVDHSVTAVQVGAGLQIPAGPYARIAVLGALGTDARRTDGAGRGPNGRVDVVARFLFDPFRQSRWGLSAGGGVSLRADARRSLRPYLLTVLELEGPRRPNGVSPSVQVGLGGGVRIGAALRWGDQQVR